MIAANRVRDRLSKGLPVLGPIINFDAPWYVDIAGASGFDFVMLDAEHGPLDPLGIETMVRAAEQAGMAALARVPANLPHEILRFLDLGVVGIQVPHIDSAAEARAAADAMRYEPRGKRGLAGTTRAAGYGLSIDLPAYTELANREVLCMPMIETAAAVKAVDEIAATDGVDLLAIGPSDLSMSMGLRGNRSAPEVQRAIDHVIARAKVHGKWTSLPAVDVESARQVLARGADVVMMSPAAWLAKVGRDLVAAVKGGSS